MKRTLAYFRPAVTLWQGPNAQPRPRVRMFAVALLAAALVAAWSFYLDYTPLHLGFPRHIGELLPLYANRLPIDLDDPARARALLIAAGTMLAGVIAVVACVATRRPIWICLPVALAAVLATNVSVAHVRKDHAGFLEPFSRRQLEYHTDLPLVRGDPLAFIREYPSLNRRLSHHAGTHPPGGVLFLYAAQQAFGPAPEPPPQTPQEATQRLIARWRAGPQADPTLPTSVWSAVGFTALAVLPAYWLATLVGGAAAARRLLPLYVAAPNLVLFGATCMDGVFLVFVLTALAVGVAAVLRRSFVWPIVAGIALWLATFMTFASIAVPVLLVALAIVESIRRPRRALGPLARCAAVGVVFVACQLIAQRTIGYDLRATAESAMHVDLRGLGVTGYESRELWACFTLANAGAIAVGSGVFVTSLAAVALASATLRRRLLADRLGRFGLALFVTIAALAGSTLFTLETERVWLFLTPPLIAVATRALRGKLLWTFALLAGIAQTLWIETNYKTWW